MSYPGRRLAPRYRPNPWTAWLATALVAIGCSTFAFLQVPPGDADHPPTGWGAMMEPLERNAWLRIQRGQALEGSAELIGVQAGSDGKSAWAGVSDGSVLHTTNGGRTWRSTRLELPPGAALTLLRMAGDGRGWALDSAGALYTTRDGGDSWQPERLGTEPRVRGLAISPNGRRAIALGESNFWEWQAGDTWTRQGSIPASSYGKEPAQGRPIPLSVTDSGAHAVAWPTRVVRVGAGGVAVLPLSPGVRPRAIHLAADGKQVLVAGEDGTLRGFEGDVEQVQYRDPEGALYDLDVLDSRGGWAVGARGHVVSSRNGTSWLVAPRAGGSTLTAISMAADSERGWAISGATGDATTLPGTGTIWHTADRGETWHRQLVLSESITLQPVDKEGSARAVTTTGTAMKSVDGGETWKVVANLSPGAAAPPQDANAMPPQGVNAASPGYAQAASCGEQRRCPVRAVVDARGWAVDEAGTLLFTRDGAKTWTPQASSGVTLTAIEGGMRGGSPFFIGTDGRHLYRARSDGGWEAVRYSWWPAPWYFASLLVVVLLVRQSLQAPAPRQRESVADLLVTDKPIENITDDVLGIHELAQGISRFIRNEQTQPSLTLAVTGEWGTGKSSLLNLLQSDLRRFGFNPVWFNAWHHESEENLIAALYARIISQATPTLPSWEAVAFRWRLLRRQTTGLSRAFLISLLLLTTGTGYFIARQEHLTDLLQHAQNAAESLSDFLSTTLEQKPRVQPPSTHYEVSLQQTKDGGWTGSLETQAPPGKDANPGDTDPPSQWLAALSTLVGLAGIGRSVLQQLKAFGVDPARLAASMAGSDQARDHRESVGFHARFAKDFGDVTRALAPRRMVILVDDLDRCSPESTLKMLEAINFLVTSGECFVVMAISDSVVQEYLGSQLRELAEAFPAIGSDSPHDRRLAYARKYLEKLINVEVKLPPMQKAQAQDLLTQHHDCDDPHEDEALRQRRAALAVAQRQRDASSLAARLRMRISLAVVVGLCLGAGLYGGSVARHQAELASAESAPPTEATADEAAPVESPAAPAPAKAPTRPAAAWRLREPPASPPRWWVFASAFFALAMLTLWTIRQRAVVVRDSHAFLDALRAWNDVITEKNTTPRAVKRYLNRVRFYAMRQRTAITDEQDFLSGVADAWLEGSARGRNPFGRVSQGLMSVGQRLARPTPPPDRAEGEPSIPEPLLVALTALAEASPELQRNPDFAELLKNAAMPMEGPLRDQVNRLVDGAGFRQLDDAARTMMVATFRRMSGGLEVR